MATEILVTESINQGEALLRELDSAGFPVSAALWYRDGGTWRYIIATPEVDRVGARETYGEVNDILRAKGIGMALSDITVVGSEDRLVALIRAAIHTGAHDIAGIRFTAGTINHVYIEDAYIYRAA